MAEQAFEWDKENPLTRCKGETRRANSSLTDYAMMGAGRSLRKLQERYQTVPESSPSQPPTRRLPTLKGWSVRYSWQARVEAWDDQQDDVQMQEYVHDLRLMQERHVRLAVALQKAAILRLQQFEPSELTPAQLLRFVVEAIRLERLARGLPEYLLQILEMTDEQLLGKYARVATELESG